MDDPTRDALRTVGTMLTASRAHLDAAREAGPERAKHLRRSARLCLDDAERAAREVGGPVGVRARRAVDRRQPWPRAG